MFSDATNTLSPTHTEFYNACWHFTQTKVCPEADHAEASHSFPQTLWHDFAAQGLLGLTAPTALGGQGKTYLEHVLAMQAISRGSAAIGLSYCAHSNLCVSQLCRVATPELQQRYLPELIRGQKVGALAMTEDHAGSDILSLQTSAKQTQDGYLLNGHKMWITNAPCADVAIIYARDETLMQQTNTDTRKPRISAFLVDLKQPGVQASLPLKKLGMRGSPTGRLELKNCFVPKENLLGEPGQATKILMQGLNYERLVLCGGPIGIIEACFDLIGPQLTQRQQFGQPQETANHPG